MTMREKLIEMIQHSVGGCARYWAEIIADGLLANGVIVPPCKVGDTVYQTDGARIYSSKIRNIIYSTDSIDFDESAIGESIYLTKEQAEKALKESEKQ